MKVISFQVLYIVELSGDILKGCLNILKDIAKIRLSSLSPKTIVMALLQ